MKFAVGTCVRDTENVKYTIIEALGAGGQGEAFLVHDPAGARRVLKVFHKPLCGSPLRKRMDWLRRRQFHRFTELIAGPIATLDERFGVGYLMPAVRGTSLETHLLQGTYNFAQYLGIAASLARAVAVFERAGAAHGDIASGNVMVRELSAGVPVGCLIDLDSVMATGLTASGFIGQDFYRAPELFVVGALPSVLSDRFSLAVLLHELLLLRHPFSPHLAPGASFREYEQFVARGQWPDDPQRTPRISGGYPVAALPSCLHALFRAAFGARASQRPSAELWADGLEWALERVVACAYCAEQCINSRGLRACPHCGERSAPVGLFVNGHFRVINAEETVLGRRELGGASALSAAHLKLSAYGLGCLCVTDISTNGTQHRIRGHSNWNALVRGVPVMVGVGDTLLLANHLQLFTQASLSLRVAI